MLLLPELLVTKNLNSGGDFSHFKLMPFGLEEIKLFSKHWYNCIAEHTDKDYIHAGDQANSLYSSISRNPSVIRLATNPLLMTIIAMIHYKGKKLPNKRVELYDISTETFLEYWVQLRMDDESRLKDKNEMIEILAPIAFEIHENKSNGLIEEKEFEHSFLLNFKKIHTNTPEETAKRECREFINFLRQQAGFFYEKGIDDEDNRFYGFIHLTFEEYLAAIELLSRWNEDELDLKSYIFNPRWIEIIRLAASLGSTYKGRSGRKQSTQFVKEILSIEYPFPEAYRPLQLVCLILSDDVNIMDEFLNEILDKIFEVVAKMDSGELIESFSKLFKELLYSDYREAFIGRCEKEVITCNSNLLNNLIFLLVSNSWDREINKILLSILGTNEENIFKAIYQIIWKNYPFQNTKVYKENFKNYLSYLKSQNDEIGLNKAMHNFILMESKGTYWRPEPEEFIRIIDQFLGTELFDIFLAYCVNDCMYNSIPFNQYAPKGKPFYNLYQLIERYSDNVLAKNLDTSLEVMDSFVVPFFSSAQSIKFVLNHHNVILAYYDNKIINIVFWSRSLTIYSMTQFLLLIFQVILKV